MNKKGEKNHVVENRGCESHYGTAFTNIGVGEREEMKKKLCTIFFVPHNVVI